MLEKKLRSFGYAFNGLRIAVREEFNFKIHIILGLVAVSFGFLFHITRSEWLFVIGASGLVFTAELLNTSLEELCDMMRSTHDPHVAKIKDLAAAAVLMASLAALAMGLIIFIPHFLSV